MGADFIATGLWRRGTVQLVEAEVTETRERIRALPAKDIAKNLSMLWEAYEDDPHGMLDLDAEREFDPVEEAETIADAVRKTLEGDFDWLADTALKGGDRGVTTMRVGPYEVLVMGEMSWGDLSDEQEGLGRLADSRVLEPLGFYQTGYFEKPGSTYGAVLSAIFDCIGDRHELDGTEVAARARSLDFDEDRAWRETLGYAVDQIDDSLQSKEAWPDSE